MKYLYTVSAFGPPFFPLYLCRMVLIGWFVKWNMIFRLFLQVLSFVNILFMSMAILLLLLLNDFNGGKLKIWNSDGNMVVWKMFDFLIFFFLFE